MQSAIQYIQSALSTRYPETEIKSFSFLIIEKLTGFTRTQILLNKNTIFSTEQRHEINSIVEKLKKYIPIQYILGETEFYGLTLMVNESVLIPRPETEELVEWIQKENDKNSNLKLLDIGTGSGCIAISLKHIFEKAEVDAFDVSEEALRTAKNNAIKNNVNVTFTKVDIFNAPHFEKKWDVIVSNPPYIPTAEKKQMQPNVLLHEPHLALFVPDEEPLLFYKEIAHFAQKNLALNGKLYFEIHRSEGQSCMQLLTEMGFRELELRKDISGNDRMVRAIK